METMTNKKPTGESTIFEIIIQTHALCNDLDMGTINVASELY
jgi:hypothetical protein